MSGAYAGRQAQDESEKGRVDRTKVGRYWPGRAPKWAEEQQAGDQAAAAQERVRTEVTAPVIVRRAGDDPRLARLKQSHADKDEALAERRQIRAAEVVRARRREPSEEPSGSEEPDDDDVRRDRDTGARARRRTPEGEGGSEDEQESSELEGDMPRAEVQRRQAQVKREDDDDEDATRRRQAVRER